LKKRGVFVSFLKSIWSTLLGAWIRFGLHVFPPTIHPMIVHFPIALLFLALLIEILRIILPPSETRFYDRAGYWVVFLSVFACIAAAAAGVISEQYVRFTPAAAKVLSEHQLDAVITILAAILAVVVRSFTRYPDFNKRDKERWTLFGRGRGRPTWLSTLLVLIAVIMVSITGHLGGTMVYHYGAGTPSTFRQPLQQTLRVRT
jgi:uncharacterized membrane protein